MTAKPNPPLYFLLHVPKTAGETIELHLIEHSEPGTVWIPRRASPLEALSGARYGRYPLPDAARVHAVSGHYVFQSQERHFRGRVLRRAVLLRDPISLCVSFYNYRMMSYLAQGRSTYGFELHQRTMPRDPVAHFLLSRWLGRRWPVLMAMGNERKYRLLNRMLSTFWFVGAYTDADRLVAAIASDLGVPPVARRRNTSRDWQNRTRWRLLTPDRLSPAQRAEIIASNPLDWALWESWRNAGFEPASVRPRALDPIARSRFLAHELVRPAFFLARRLLRDGWGGLSPARTGMPAGLVRADRARDLGEWQSAARHYRKVLAEVPDAVRIWVQYGHALKESGRIEEAEGAYREAIRLDPDDADSHLQLGHALKITGRTEEARVAYQRALDCDPGLDHAAAALRGLGSPASILPSTAPRGNLGTG
jgi:hypothetical protein